MNTVTVIVVNWNGRDFLQDCLLSLQKQENIHCAIVLVDNGSTDGSADWVEKEFPKVHLIRLPGNYGFSVANNIALQRVETDYVALLNNDAVAHPLWLSTLVDGLEKDPQAGSAACKMVFSRHPEMIDRAGDGYTMAGAGKLRGRGASSRAFENTGYIFGASAGAAIYRTRMLKDVGLFDEDYFLLYEDVDLSFRAQLKGYKCLYIPNALVYHMATRSIGYDSPTSVYYGHRNLEWTYIKNMPNELIIKTLWLHMLYNVAAFSYFLYIGQGSTFIRAKWDAVKGLNAAMGKRKKIQQQRRVGNRYISGLLDKELFLPRFTRRLKKE